MLPFIITYFILGLVSAVIQYGAYMAYFQREFSLIAEEHYREDVKSALGLSAFALIFPIIFWISVLIEGDTFKHGLLFTNPHKKKDMITKCEKCNCYSCRCQQIDFISKPKEQRCAECGGMFLESKMKPVETITLHASAYNKTEFYCVTHQSPYDKKYLTTHGIEYFKTIPAHEVECDADGKEIKGKK